MTPEDKKEFFKLHVDDKVYQDMNIEYQVDEDVVITKGKELWTWIENLVAKRVEEAKIDIVDVVKTELNKSFPTGTLEAHYEEAIQELYRIIDSL